MDERYCKKCDEVHGPTLWHRAPKGYWVCVVCRRESRRQSYYRNREKQIAKSSLYQKKNKEKKRGYQKTYYEKNRQQVLAHSRARYEANKELERLRGRLKYRRAKIASILENPALRQKENPT